MGRVASTKSLTSRRGALLPLAFLAVLIATSGLWSGSALALSEIKREPSLQTPQAADGSVEKETLPPVGTVPIPDSSTSPSEPSAPDEAAPDETSPGDEGVPGEEEAAPEIDPNTPPPEVLYDLSKLPEPVRRLHDRIIEICKSGDVEKLRPFLETGENATQLSFGGVDGDPIAYLKESSGDKQGHEMLAILEEVLSAGYVHMDPGTPNEMFVWPYFFAVPLDKLTAPQQVELFKIVTAGDYEEMKTYGTYIFYRVGITPEGRWSFFVAGD
jgi:hypothetical protein